VVFAIFEPVFNAVLAAISVPFTPAPPPIKSKARLPIPKVASIFFLASSGN
jgi:hypothetical protein